MSEVDLSTPAAAFLSGFDCGRAVGHQEGWAAGFVEGHQDGDRRAREDIEREWRGQLAVSAAVARMVATAGPYADLAERRGEPHRATAQRALLADRGIS